jgi:RNA polymerase sigma-70 factor, ECF subfamily
LNSKKALQLNSTHYSIPAGIKGPWPSLRYQYGKADDWGMRMASTQIAVTEEMQVRLVLGGDAGAFCELIRPYRRRLYLKTLSIVGNDADAEEVVQNAFLKAFYKISQFRQEATFYTWLFRITVNEARMWLRSSRRHIHESLDNNNEDGEGQFVREIADSREGPFEVLEKKQVRRAIFKALRRLSAGHREVIVLRDLRLCSTSETARILAISEINVRSRLRRGRAQLRRALAEVRTIPTSRHKLQNRRTGMQFGLPNPTNVYLGKMPPENVTGCSGDALLIRGGRPWPRHEMLSIDTPPQTGDVKT